MRDEQETERCRPAARPLRPKASHPRQCPKPNEVLARFEPVNLVRFGPDQMGIIFPRSDLSISGLISLASERVYTII